MILSLCYLIQLIWKIITVFGKYICAKIYKNVHSQFSLVLIIPSTILMPFLTTIKT